MERVFNIPRTFYLDRIFPYVDKDLIKVLVGQRRVGKSFILDSVAQMIKTDRPQANIITIDLEDFAFSHITDAQSLHDEITSHISATTRNYIFVDEIQEVEGFEKAVRSLNKRDDTDIYLTGSNSKMLSSEIGSRLAGRSVEINVHPLTYQEFLEFHSLEDSDSSVESYLRYGGMPYLRNLSNRQTWNEYLVGLVDALVYRDIVTRHSIRNVDFLQRLLLFLADNIGQLFTAKRIADYIKSQRISSSVSSVQTYVDYICEACLINKVKRWDIEGKKNFEIGEKYYFEDLGIRNAIIGYRPMDIGGLLENAVFNQLLHDGYKVKVGVLAQGKEIDFIAEKDGEIKYIQVAVTVRDEATAEREFGNLMGIPDNYEKIVVTYHDSAPTSYQGIRMVTLRQFLLGN